MNVRTMLLAIAYIFATTAWSFAGTTGVLHGYVFDVDHQPVRDALVTATSVTESATTHTDSHVYYVFLSLLPDNTASAPRRSPARPLRMLMVHGSIAIS